ncbi:MAG: TraR/DksA C4-type zinc finger protein [Chloroflexi bacterium]|nr:TraR/DksA C4-type zinc finger protein [Chloroflexota bacterium]
MSPTTISPKTLARLRTALEEERDRLQKQIVELGQQLKELHESGAEEDGFGSHPADVSGDTYLEEVQASIMDKAQETLRQIQNALERMDRKTYGRCIDCGTSILMERLEARPYAARCLPCQATYDRAQRERGAR